MPRFRKKPVVVEAWRVADIVRAAAHDRADLPTPIAVACASGGWVFDAVVDGRPGVRVPTLEGSLFAAADDWIVRGVQGEFYPCKPDVFELTYERVD